jgi:hypothetical protein
VADCFGGKGESGDGVEERIKLNNMNRFKGTLIKILSALKKE